MILFRAEELQVELVRPKAVVASGDPQGNAAILARNATQTRVDETVE